MTGKSRSAVIDLDAKVADWDQMAYVENLSQALNISKGRIVITKVEGKRNILSFWSAIFLFENSFFYPGLL
jgi:hypothetical protein